MKYSMYRIINPEFKAQFESVKILLIIDALLDDDFVSNLHPVVNKYLNYADCPIEWTL